MSLYKYERYYQDGRQYGGRWIFDQEKKTDDNGYYEFGNLGPIESYQLKAKLEGYLSFSSSIGFLKSEQMNIDVFLEKRYVDTNKFVILEEVGIAVQKLDISAGSINKKLAEELCAASTVGGYTNWRLPTLSELNSMYNNRSLLPDIKSNWYWSSSLVDGYYMNYYLVNMGTGAIGSKSYNSGNCARCVRSIQ